MVDEKTIKEIAELSNEEERDARIKELARKEKERISQELSQEGSYEGERALGREVSRRVRNFKGKLKDRVNAARGGGQNIDQSGAVIFRMNIYYKGSLIDATMLDRVPFNNPENNLEIKNPNEDALKILTNEAVLNSMFPGIGETGKRNLAAIRDVLQDYVSPARTIELDKGIQIDTFLGAVYVPGKQEREEIYDYFRMIREEKFPQFIDDAIDFFDSISELPEPEEEEQKREHQKLLKSFKDLQDKYGLTAGKKNSYLQDRLQYIGVYGKVELEVVPEELRFISYLGQIIASKGYFDLVASENNAQEDAPEEERDNDESSENWEAEALTAALEGAENIQSSWDRSTSVDLDVRSDQEDIESDLEGYLEELDPLLAFEYKKNERLLAITEEAEDKLIDALRGARENLESQEIVWDEDYDTKIENWIENLTDTTIIDDMDEFYLPISFLENKFMAELYDDEVVDGADIKNIEYINQFFEDFSRLIVEEANPKDRKMTLATYYQSTGPVSGGTDMRATFAQKPDATERQGEQRVREAAGKQSQLIGSRGRKGGVPASIRELARPVKIGDEEVKSALQRMIESAGEYYFEPAFSGRMVVEIPDFVSEIGGKIIEIQGAELGFETIMGPAYSQLAGASPVTFKEEDLADISSFLEKTFLKSIEIDRDLIQSGLNAAKALTKIFGKKEENYNYTGGLIGYLAKEVGDEERINTDFAGKTLQQRYEAFGKAYGQRKAIPIFAMPYWLNSNRGLIKQRGDEMSKQYERIVGIFQEVQSDLPVLLRKMLKAHDAIREELGKPVIYGMLPTTTLGYDTMIRKMQTEENLDLSSFEVESIVKELDSHQNISKEFGISTEQVYLIKAHFR